VVRLSLQILEDLPARLVDMQMTGRGVAGAALRARTASSSGSSSKETARSAPTRLPFAISSPSALSAATIRSSGRARTYFSKTSRARNRELNSPFRSGLGGTSATTTPFPLHRQVFVHLRRRCRAQMVRTCQSTWAEVSSSKGS
jgi:hypothetical protein